MIVFKKTELDLGDQINRPQIPYVFEGKNTSEEKLYIETSSSCGCTSVRNKFWVEPKEEFKLDGYLTKRPATQKYAKSVYVKAYDKVGTGRKQKFYRELKFTVNVI